MLFVRATGCCDAPDCYLYGRLTPDLTLVVSGGGLLAYLLLNR